MQLKKNSIVILSMILLLFVIGYAYNMFGNKFIDTSLDGEIEDAAFFSEDYNMEDFNVEDYSIDSEEPDSAIIETGEPKASNDDYNPFQEASSVAIVENKEQTAVEASSSSFFSEYRLERDKNRSKEVEMWQEIINNQNTQETFKELAQQELVKIVALIEKEMIIENLIISRGFNDALVFLTDDAVTVIVETNELTQAQVAQIQDIIVRKTKLDPNNIKIMKKN